MAWKITSELLMFLMSILAIIGIVIQVIIIKEYERVYKYLHSNISLTSGNDGEPVTFYGTEFSENERTGCAAWYLYTFIQYLYLGLCCLTYNWWITIPVFLLLLIPKKKQGVEYIIYSSFTTILAFAAMIINYAYFHHLH